MSTVTGPSEKVTRYLEWSVPCYGLHGAAYAEVETAISLAMSRLKESGLKADSDDCIRVFPGEDEIIVRVEVPVAADEQTLELEFYSNSVLIKRKNVHPGMVLDVPPGTTSITVTP